MKKVGLILLGLGLIIGLYIFKYDAIFYKTNNVSFDKNLLERLEEIKGKKDVSSFQYTKQEQDNAVI